MIPESVLCDYEGASWFLFNAGTPPIILLADYTAIVLSIILGIFILKNNTKGLPNRILFTTIMAFAAWAFCALISDTTNRVDLVMTSWATSILIEPIVYMGSLYLLYVLIDKRDTIPFVTKLLFGLLYLPIILAAPTNFMLDGMGADLASCLSNEAFIATYYAYSFEIFIVVWIIALAIRRYLSATEPTAKKEVVYLTLGTLFLLVSFSWGNIIGSVTDDWELARYGLFGMPIFSGFLIYSIVRYQTFNIKLLASVALVLALLGLIFLGLFV